MKKCILTILFAFFVIAGYAQELTLIKQVKINRPVAVSTDRYANMYIADVKGNLHKYDSTGNLLFEYTPAQMATITSLEAWPTIQVFVFYRDLQQYTFLNRFLTVTNTPSGTFNSGEIGFARTATLASDESIWLFDDKDFSLKKYNPRFSNLTIQVPLEILLSSSEYAINYMREYQNMLFINDKNSGILVFDNFGNYRKKLPFTGINYFNFLDNQLYYLSSESIELFDIYTLTSHSVSLPKGISFEFVLVFANQVVLFSKDSLYIYQLNNR